MIRLLIAASWEDSSSASDVNVQYAVHGADALEKIPEINPDLVVTDLIMPEMDGLTLVATIKRKFNYLPVILMTSKGSGTRRAGPRTGRVKLCAQGDPLAAPDRHGPQRWPLPTASAAICVSWDA